MIIKQEQKEVLQSLGKSLYAKTLNDFLTQAKEEMGDIRTCKSWEETLGRQFAVNLIDDLFKFMKDSAPVEKKVNNYE